MKKIEFSRVGITLTEREILLGMNVDPSAGACANVVDFYQEAMVTESDVNDFLNVPFNKGKKRIPQLATGRILQPWACNWNGKDISLSAKETEVDKVAGGVEICISDIEESFLVDRMVNGANNPVNPADFLAFVWSYIAKKIQEEREYLRWLGNKSVPDAVDNFTDLTDGYLVQLETAPVLASKINAAVTIDETNVIAELLKVISAVPKIHRQPTEREDLKIFISSDIAIAFQTATATSTAMGAFITNTGDMFLGRYKLIEKVYLPDRTIVASPKQDLIYTYDIVDDEKNFTIIDRRYVSADEVVRFRVNLYFGFDIYDATNIVYYRPLP